MVLNFNSKSKSPEDLCFSYPHGPVEPHGRMVDRAVLSVRSDGPWHLGFRRMGLVGGSETGPAGLAPRSIIGGRRRHEARDAAGRGRSTSEISECRGRVKCTRHAPARAIRQPECTERAATCKGRGNVATKSPWRVVLASLWRVGLTHIVHICIHVARIISTHGAVGEIRSRDCNKRAVNWSTCAHNETKKENKQNKNLCLFSCSSRCSYCSNSSSDGLGAL